MKSIQTQYYKTPVGELLIGSYDHKLCLCDWRYRKMRNRIDERIQQGLNATYEVKTSEVIQQTISQLIEYFEQKRTSFDLPLLYVGTDFQKSVWNSLKDISFGETQTYLGLAKELGNVKAVRAIANANGANSISIIIPCHRIIGSDGKLVGYAGGLDAKRKLLEIEQQRTLS